MTDLRERILDAMDAIGWTVTPATVRQLTIQLYGIWWTQDDEELVGRVVGEMVRDGQLKWSGITLKKGGIVKTDS